MNSITTVKFLLVILSDMGQEKKKRNQIPGQLVQRINWIINLFITLFVYSNFFMVYFYFYFLITLFLFSYSCLHFLPPTPHPSQSHLPSLVHNMFSFIYLFIYLNFLIKIFNYNLHSILYYVSFRCTAQQLENHTLYKVFCLVFSVPNWHLTQLLQYY